MEDGESGSSVWCPPPATAVPIFIDDLAAQARLSFLASPGGVFVPFPGFFPVPAGAAEAALPAERVAAAVTAPAVRIWRRFMTSPMTQNAKHFVPFRVL